MPASGPDRCPWCDYDLQGLPPPHRCPECGTEYDEHTRIWRTSYPRALWVPLVLGAVFSVQQLCFILVNHARGRPVGVASVVVAILCATIAILMAVLIPRVKLKRWLAITPRGLVIRYVLGPELILWDNLTEVTPSRYRRRVFIHRKSRGPFKEKVDGILKHGGEVTEFVAAVREAKARYATRAIA